MLKKPTIEELESQSDCDKIKTLSYNEIAYFIIDRFTLKNRTFLISLASVFLLTVINILFFVCMKKGPGHPSVFLGIVAGYIIIPILLAPFHEAIHWIFMKLAGAKDIRIGMDLKQGIIYLSANRYVIGKRTFAIIAFAPFVIISAALILAIFLFTSPWLQWVISSILLIHATMCIGDVILAGFMFSFPHAETWTWDDADKKESYFYVSAK